MKIQITIEDGKVTVDYEDQRVALVRSTTPIKAAIGVDNEVVNKKPPADKSTYKSRDKEGTRDAKNCTMCGDEFQPKKSNQVLCGKPECKREYARRANKKWVATKKEKVTDDPVEWCKKCKAYTTHTTADHPASGSVMSKPAPLNPGPDFMPGHEKSPQEIEDWKPKPILPGDPNYSAAPRDDTETSRKVSPDYRVGSGQ